VTSRINAPIRLKLWRRDESFFGKWSLIGRGQREDYDLDRVVDVCVAGDSGYEVTKVVCDNLKRAAAEHKTYGFGHNQLLKALLKVQPRAVLDAFLTRDDKAVAAGAHFIQQSCQLQPNPMDEVSEGALFEWCADDPISRYPAVASVVSVFTLRTDGNPTSWTPIASRLVHGAPDPIAVMSTLIARFRPMIWSGSRSPILETGTILLDQFDVQGNVELAAFIALQKTKLQQEARDYLDWETKLDKDRDERFE
jgi:hypothetical protein